jgi:hypothetical protein
LDQVAAGPFGRRLAGDLESGEGRNHGKSHHRSGESAEKGADSTGRLDRARGLRLRRRCGPETHFGFASVLLDPWPTSCHLGLVAAAMKKVLAT